MRESMFGLNRTIADTLPAQTFRPAMQSAGRQT